MTWHFLPKDSAKKSKVFSVFGDIFSREKFFRRPGETSLYHPNCTIQKHCANSTAKLLSWRDFELLNGRLQVGKYPMKVWPFSKKTRILSVKTTSDQGLVTGIIKKRKKRQDGWQAPSSPKRSFSLIGPKLHSYRRKELAAPFRVGEWDRTSWCWWIWHKATTKTMGNTAFLQSPLLFVRPGPEKSPRVEVGKCEFKSRKISMTQPEPLTTFLKKLPFYFQPA